MRRLTTGPLGQPRLSASVIERRSGVMTRALRCGSVMGGLMLGLACGIEQPTAPSTVRTLPTLTRPPQPLPLGEPVAAYVFSGALDYPIGALTTGSQYILY